MVMILTLFIGISSILIYLWMWRVMKTKICTQLNEKDNMRIAKYVDLMKNILIMSGTIIVILLIISTIIFFWN